MEKGLKKLKIPDHLVLLFGLEALDSSPVDQFRMSFLVEVKMTVMVSDDTEVWVECREMKCKGFQQYENGNQKPELGGNGGRMVANIVGWAGARWEGPRKTLSALPPSST